MRIDNLINKLKSGMMNELDKPEVKAEINNIENNFKKVN